MTTNVSNLLERIPTMSDKELAVFLGNVSKFKEAGSSAQRNAAAELLPAIDAEVTKRKVEKAANAPKRAPRKKAVKVAV